jgi:hypothetical protein
MNATIEEIRNILAGLQCACWTNERTCGNCTIEDEVNEKLDELEKEI